MAEQGFPQKSSGPALDGKVAVITGAAKGIGLGCARVLGAAGAAIAGLDLDQAGLHDALQPLQSHDVTAEGYVANVGQAADVTDAIDQVVKRFGRIDILVNNAGTHDGKGTEEASASDWDRIITNNLKSVFLITRAALPYLKASRGSIVNMGSMVGLVGQAKSAAYSASKGGIAALTKNMALDFAPYGIRVNCVCPGWVETPLVNAWFSLQPDETASRAYVNSIHPLGRIASADEIGNVVLFLASDQASFVTGVAIPVDGGVTLGY
jgi:NAD(P)-dependent dehydrogenase (short-subunit alcohol dehydrogenase family)